MQKPAQSKGIDDQPQTASNEVKLPSSRKIYVETNGNTVNQTKHNLRVPFREIALSPSKDFDGRLEENPPVRVYDTSGIWTDPKMKCDVREGLPALRRDWIVGRGDVEEYVGREILPQDNGYLTKGAEEYARVSGPDGVSFQKQSSQGDSRTQQAHEVTDLAVHHRFVGHGAADFIAQHGPEFPASPSASWELGRRT